MTLSTVARDPRTHEGVDHAEHPLEQLLATSRVVCADLWPEVQRMPIRADPRGGFDFSEHDQAV